jgi:hypothetical protein
MQHFHAKRTQLWPVGIFKNFDAALCAFLAEFLCFYEVLYLTLCSHEFFQLWSDDRVWTKLFRTHKVVHIPHIPDTWIPDTFCCAKQQFMSRCVVPLLQKEQEELENKKSRTETNFLELKQRATNEAASSCAHREKLWLLTSKCGWFLFVILLSFVECSMHRNVFSALLLVFSIEHLIRSLEADDHFVPNLFSHFCFHSCVLSFWSSETLLNQKIFICLVIYYV